MPGRRKISRAGAYIKPLSFSALFVPFVSSSSRKYVIIILLSKSAEDTRKAIIAIARMLLTAIYNMLKKNEPYTARANSHPHIEKFPWKKPSSFYNVKVI